MARLKSDQQKTEIRTNIGEEDVNTDRSVVQRFSSRIRNVFELLPNDALRRSTRLHVFATII